MQKAIARITSALGALFVAACGGQSASIPGSAVRGPTYATQAVASQPLGFLTGGLSVPAEAQETVLHRFGGVSDGAVPEAGLTDLNGVLYGTTRAGGSHRYGTVFRITTAGVETVLYSFSGGENGEQPYAGLTAVNGVLYGTTSGIGSNNNNGTVFEITTSGAETTLHRFEGRSDGQTPLAELTNVNGVLYGTTAAGGANGDGIVFKITTSGEESVLYSFQGGSDGNGPQAGLTNVSGVLYGTTYSGGGSGYGTVFKITTSGTESVLHSFGGEGDGQSPKSAPLTEVNGVLYGTTVGGGLPVKYSNGTVYKITTSGTEKVIHSFGGGSDGKSPEAGLTDVNGVLYGTTLDGGVDNNTGTVFKITTSGAKSAVYRFAGGGDGKNPVGDLTYVNGMLYGTTVLGGRAGGTVFSLSL